MAQMACPRNQAATAKSIVYSYLRNFPQVGHHSAKGALLPPSRFSRKRCYSIRHLPGRHPRSFDDGIGLLVRRLALG